MIDPKNWNFTGTIDKTGGTTGEAAEISLQQAIDKGQVKLNADGSLTVRVNVVGAKTTGTKYTRGEARELNDDGSKAAWTLAQGGQMLLTTQVDVAPKCAGGTFGKMVLSQAHGQDNELFRTYRNGDGTVDFHCDISGDDHAEHIFPLKNASGVQMKLSLGQKASFRHTVSKDKGLLTEGFLGEFNADGSIPAGAELFTAGIPKLDAKWSTDTFYFKAFSYLGVNTDTAHGGADPAGYGQITASLLLKGHPLVVALPATPAPAPKPAPQPLAPPVTTANLPPTTAPVMPARRSDKDIAANLRSIADELSQ